MKIIRLAQQDFDGYFTGNVEKLNTPSLNTSEIQSAFNRANDAIQLAQSYPGGALQDINYIFNYSKSGSYGVYIPKLERAQRTEVLRKMLEQQRGYKVVDENGMLTAYPVKDNKSNEEIQKEIKNLWDQIESSGGHVLGVNMNASLAAATENANQIQNDAKNNGGTVADPELLWQMLAVLSVAATIIHEAAHSKGADEGGAQGEENKFAAWAIDQVNTKYKQELEGKGLGDTFAPIQFTGQTRHADGNNWYKRAQYTSYLPSNFTDGKPRGSDLDGRSGKGSANQSDAMGDWAMLFQRHQGTPIEKRLSREFMAPLAKGLSQEHNTIEEQLRKQFAGDTKPDPHLIHEELLQRDHKDDRGYKALETLLEETRPQPLLLPYKKSEPKRTEKKASNNFIKTATLFGWYNNLSISDGSTIPGLGDRVMAWEDRDEDFARDDDWVSKQPRYNPTYDLKGFYYRWIEPRFKPQLWDDMTQDLVNTHPAKRFAGTLDPSLVEILNILATIKDKILSGNIRATRLIVTEDIVPIVKKVLGIDGIKFKGFRFGETENGEKIYAIWIFDVDVEEESVSRAEARFQNKDLSSEVSDMAEDLLGTSYVRMNAVSEIVNAAKEVCKSTGIDDIYIVGVYSRERMMGNDQPDVEQLDFTSNSADKSLKVGQLVAKKLNAAHVLANKSFVFSFVHKGIRVDFSGKNDLHDMMNEIRKKGVRCDSPLLIDLANRDFTINMFAFNIATNKVEDPFKVAGKAMEDNKVETFIDPNVSIKENPIIMLRALKLKLRYDMELSEDLQKAILINAELLFGGKLTRSQLIFARESVRVEGSKEADALFEQYRIEKIKDVK